TEDDTDQNLSQTIRRQRKGILQHFNKLVGLFKQLAVDENFELAKQRQIMKGIMFAALAIFGQRAFEVIELLAHEPGVITSERRLFMQFFTRAEYAERGFILFLRHQGFTLVHGDHIWRGFYS